MTLDISIEKVKPRTAENWFTGRRDNRNFNESVAQRYMTDMEEGKWLTNGVPIVFNTKGQLMDGQHRMFALAKSGMTLEMVVVRGVKDEAMTTYDIGLPRKLSDFLKLRGETHTTTLAAIVSHTMRWDRYQTFQHRSVHVRPTIAQAIEYFDEHADEFRFAALLGSSWMRKVLITSSVVGALYIILCGAGDESDVDEFFELLASGAGMGEYHPIMALRRRLIDSKSATAAQRLAPYIHAALTIKAWNAYVSNTDVKSLIWKAGGKTPEPFPTPKAGG